MLCYCPISEPSKGIASILSFGDIKILLDPGSDDLLSEFVVLDFVPDLILFSHSDIFHLGSFVHGFKNCGWHNVPVYATLPIFNMGRVTMTDCYKNLLDNSISKEDIDEAFDSIIALRYSQPMPLSGKLNGIFITAYNFGHSLGGTIWKITKDSENIVYCVDWNHSKDSHLNGSILYSNGVVLDALSRPTTLITDSINSSVFIPSRKKRIEAFFDSIRITLTQLGSVLIPTDAATRSLEFCWILERYWQQHNLQYPIYFLTHGGMNMDRMEIHIKIISNVHELSTMVSGPKVILATSANMDCGFSQKIFLNNIASDSKNLVILSQKSIYYENSLSKDLMDRWNLATKSYNQSIASSVVLNFSRSVIIRALVPLVGDELEKYQEKEKLSREKKTTELILEFQNRDLFDSSDSDSNDDDNNNNRIHFKNDSIVAKGSASLLNPGIHDLYLQTNEIKKMLPRCKMFPTLEKRRRFDDFGEIIIPEKFVRVMEEDLDFNITNETNKSINTLTKKRKWGGVSNNVQIKENIDKDIHIPSKIVVSEEKIMIKCSVRYIDMEGLHDGKSLKTIIPMVNPRKLVLIHSNQETRNNMMTTFKALLGDYNVSHVIGKLKLCTSSVPNETDLPTLDVLPMNPDLKSIPQSHPLFVGDVKLAHVKRVLQEQGHVAELIGEGMLLCDGLVTVKKIVGDKVILEGGISQEFYDVRKIVYDSIVEFL
ncbi:hypothetical protein MERGE_001349 [Pneumocystis wakefieldiae]|uniref:Cleavage and polyadenylation specificity factor subunit 2 n=1 Tax=Pneumocystis wakefieldiae TaxID=38082 RepID=A0A899G4A5_9ASCO|nr:hypothetical protein MERGE_001349 [Pneumocystis wakefieldiae]